MNKLINYSTEISIITDRHPIRRYLEFKKRRSKVETKKDYEKRIVDFFRFISRSVNTIEDITLTMMLSINPSNCEEYELSLENNGDKKNTIKKKISVVKNLYTYLITLGSTNENGGFSILKNNPFDIIDMRDTKDDANIYDSLKLEEIKAIKKISIKEDWALYETAIRTGVRESAILNLNIKDIKIVDNTPCITGKDKGIDDGKEFIKPITAEMYETYKELATKNYDGKIFNITRQTALNRLCGYNDKGKFKEGYIQKIGISNEEKKERGLCFHSLKKSTAILSYLESGNIHVAQEQCNHSSEKTTEKHYMIQKTNMRDNVGLKFNFEDNENELKSNLDGMSKDELVKILLSSNSIVQNELLRQML